MEEKEGIIEGERVRGMEEKEGIIEEEWKRRRGLYRREGNGREGGNYRGGKVSGMEEKEGIIEEERVSGNIIDLTCSKHLKIVLVESRSCKIEHILKNSVTRYYTCVYM